MDDPIVPVVAEIVDFEIHAIGDLKSAIMSSGSALSASIEVRVGEDYYEFGGPSMFFSIPNEGSDFFGHFVLRCFQTLGVKSTREMEGMTIKVLVSNGKVVAIASLDSDEFFFPGLDFEKLEKGNHDINE
ncbi:hypothetical protein [Dyadobacter alkalitolerans]|uniref:hypothetical protein n=1 Tax=Dyadobacter alkalitolerans TaxID=492736 RepID=UPI00047A77F5|nr:hypothetical protein [Dyadobacter alkalitolerans]